MKINRLEIPIIARLYTNEFVSAIELARRYNVTRAAIYCLLKRAGINTSYQEQAHITTTCDFCNSPITKLRSVIRKYKHAFCNSACSGAWKSTNNIAETMKKIKELPIVKSKKNDQTGEGTPS